MSFVVCDECGTKNERSSDAHPEGGAGASYVYCRACASRIELRSEQSSEAESNTVSSGSGDLLDELLSLPLAAPHPHARAAETPPAAPEASAVEASAVEEVAVSVEAPPVLESTGALSEASVALAAEAAAPEVVEGPSTEPLATPSTETSATANPIVEVAAASAVPIESPPAAPAVPAPEMLASTTLSPAVIAEASSSTAQVVVSLADAGADAADAIAAPASPLPAAQVAEVVVAPTIPIAATAPRVGIPRPSESARKPQHERKPPPKPLVRSEPPPVSLNPALEPVAPAAPVPDAAEELSWELPSPVPPPARVLETQVESAAASAEVSAVAPVVVEQPPAEAAPVALLSVEQPVADAPAEPAPELASAEPPREVTEQVVAAQPAAVHAPVEQPAAMPPPLPDTEQALVAQVVATAPIPTEAAQAIAEQPSPNDTSETQAPAESVSVQPILAAVASVAELASAQPAPVEPVREIPHIAIDSGAANIRATLPFGPTLPARETVPAIVTEEQLQAATGIAEAVPPALPATQSTSATADEPLAAPTVAPAFAVPAASAARPSLQQAPRTTSDAPTTQSWLPPEPSPSKLRRFAPLGAALVAVLAAFAAGIQVGKMNPDTRTGSAAAAAPAAPAPRAPAAEVAPPPPTATAVPASAGTPSQTDDSTSATTKVAHTAGGKPVGGFNPKAANAALGQVAVRTRSCKKAGARGTATAVVTFGPSGRVEDVTVSGARIAGTPVATCIASVLSTARVQPFAGPAQTVKRAVRMD